MTRAVSRRGIRLPLAFACLVLAGTGWTFPLAETAEGWCFGPDGLQVSIDRNTGFPSAYRVGGRIVLIADADLPSPVGFDREEPWRPQTESVRPVGEGVRAVDDSTVRADYRFGRWKGSNFIRLFPKERMVCRWFSFEWTGGKAVKLHRFWVENGRLAVRSGNAAYVLPASFPPIKRFARQFVAGHAELGNMYFPMAVADDGAGRSVMAAVNELAPYADFSRAVAIERPGGLSLSTRFETYGWMKPGVAQTVGDVWLVFRDWDCEAQLRHTAEWFAFSGQRVPEGRPDWMRSLALYSMHPCGRNEDYRSDRDGFRLATDYLPYLSALGVSGVWIRPVEDEAPYIPRDYFGFQRGVGGGADLRRYVREAHRLGIRVWRDAVIHGGRDSSPRAKAHPEWLGWMENGKPDRIWTYDYYQPTWVSAFSNIIHSLSETYGLDGWRIDVAGGSREPNWNPDIPYARGSFARCQGGLAQQRGIRAACRAVKADAATLGESMYASSALVSDSIYDFGPNLLWFYRFTDSDLGSCVRNIRRYLHEQQAALAPDALLMHYEENHDSLQSSLMHGRAGADALFAMTAWIKGYPLIYQEGEDGCFETWRRILRIRRGVDELTNGSCDYAAVGAPDGVFACLRGGRKGKSVVLVNFNGRRVRDAVVAAGRTVPFDLGPFGYEVRRIEGEPLPSFDAPAWIPPAVDAPGEPRVEVRGLDGKRKVPGARIEEIRADGVTRYRVSDFGEGDPTNAQLVIRLPGTERWFAHAADGDFDSPFVVRHPSWDRAGSTVYHGVNEGAVRWRSKDHPLGFSPVRACVGGICGNRARRIGGFRASEADVVLLDRLGAERGFAVAVRGVRPEAFAFAVEEISAAEATAKSDDLAGDSRVTTVMCGWLYEDGGLRVLVQRNGCLRGVWKRVDGAWRRVVASALVRTDTGIGRKNLFGGKGTRECKQSEEIDADMRFWREPDGTLRFDFHGDLRAYGVGGKMSVPIWYRTRYAFKGDQSFGFESAVSVERAFGMDEGELALDVRFASEVGDPCMHLQEIVTYGESALVRFDSGRRACEFLWVSGEEPFLSPKGQWNGVKMRIVP